MREVLFHQARILIIDDELTHVRFLSALLAQRGYVRIESLTDPWESIPFYKHFLPDLIILDLLMPGVGGMQVLKELRAEIPAGTYLPILIVTADLTPESRREAWATGANDFVLKPYSSDEILQRVGNLLETRFLHRELAVKHDEIEVLLAERGRSGVKSACG